MILRRASGLVRRELLRVPRLFSYDFFYDLYPIPVHASDETVTPTRWTYSSSRGEPAHPKTTLRLTLRPPSVVRNCSDGSNATATVSLHAVGRYVTLTGGIFIFLPGGKLENVPLSPRRRQRETSLSCNTLWN